MKFCLVNAFFPPDGAPTGRLLRDVAEALTDQGHRVEVLASRIDYRNEVRPEDSSTPWSVRRLGTPRAASTGLRAKLAGYREFFAETRSTLASMSPVPDALLCLTSPPFCGQLGLEMKCTSGTPYLLWCMDLYPEALRAHGLLPWWNPLSFPLTRRAARIRAEAAAVISLGPDMSEILRDDVPGNRLEEIPVWASHPPGRPAIGRPQDAAVFLYSGNMGRAHRAEEFASLAHALNANGGGDRVVFRGSGPRQKEWMRRYGDLFEWKDPVSGSALAEHLSAADVHLVSQETAWRGVVVPSKFQSACAAARPTLYAGPPEASVARWIREHDCGWVLRPGQTDGMKPLLAEMLDPDIRREKGRRAADLAGHLFDRNQNRTRIVDLLERTASIPDRAS